MLTDQMRHQIPGLACRALLFLLLSCLTAQAQSASTAQLNGTVKDQSGAALPAILQGFRTFAQTGIVLEVGANPTLAVTLELGQLEETVSVQGTAALVETRNPGIGQVITNEQVLELPLNGHVPGFVYTVEK